MVGVHKLYTTDKCNAIQVPDEVTRHMCCPECSELLHLCPGQHVDRQPVVDCDLVSGDYREVRIQAGRGEGSLRLGAGSQPPAGIGNNIMLTFQHFVAVQWQGAGYYAALTQTLMLPISKHYIYQVLFGDQATKHHAIYVL